VTPALKAPFPYFGGKRAVIADVWARFGTPKQYLEPFCGSAAMLIGRPVGAAGIEVVNDLSHNIANFWRAVKYQAEAVVGELQWPVTHIDLAARHAWLTEPERVRRLRDDLLDAEWPGDPRQAGWWCWGQCAWIGSGWCDKQIAHASDAGMGVQAPGQIAFPGSWRGDGMGVITSGAAAAAAAIREGNSDAWPRARAWIHRLSERMARVRVQAGTWDRALNHHYGGDDTAIFLDPPYRGYTKLYAESTCVADEVAEWAREHAHLRIALCGHAGDYELDGWEVLVWERSDNTYGGNSTKDAEAIWFSPACERVRPRQTSLFEAAP